MNPEITLHDRTLVWAGQHWINAIRPDGQDQPSGWFSLFATHYGPAGEGNAAQIVIPSADLWIVCTDNRPLATWTQQQFFSNSTIKTDNAPVVDATFTHEGDSHVEPTWTVQTDDHQITAKWRMAAPPVIAQGPFVPGSHFFTILLFTYESSIELDGHAVPGNPYERDIWIKSIGGLRSSSVVAISETLMHDLTT